MQIFKKPYTKKKIRLIADILKNGGLVAFPTETVYGLGANALDEKACRKIFTAKGRPSDNPLIIHIAREEDFKLYSSHVSKEAKLLIKNFCPGPLTLVMKKKGCIGPVVSGGLDTVAIRFPSHPLAQKIISTCSFPLAAPSANISGKPSPTGERDVIIDLDGKIDALVEGGETKHGLESTVIDMTSSPPTILRHGAITKEMIKKVLPNITDEADIEQKKRSPGTRYKHYAPETPIILIKAGESKNHFGKNYAFIGVKIPSGRYVFSFSSKQKLAKELYKTLRHCDSLGVDTIYIEEVSETGLGKALMNRIKKAAGLI